MQENNNIALKEWAVVNKALDQGEQIFLFRKGGIWEEEGEFVVRHPEFFLYPTYEHQRSYYLKEEYQHIYGDLLGAVTPQDRLVLENYALVEEVICPQDVEKIKALSKLHIWSRDYVDMRIRYKKTLPLHILLLRVYRLPQPWWIDITERYAGCKSWVELDIQLSTSGAIPVLDEDTFQAKVETLRTLLY